MMFTALIPAFGPAGILCFVTAVRRVRRPHLVSGAPSGLVARPLNQAAKDAVGSWR